MSRFHCPCFRWASEMTLVHLIWEIRTFTNSVCFDIGSDTSSNAWADMRSSERSFELPRPHGLRVSAHRKRRKTRLSTSRFIAYSCFAGFNFTGTRVKLHPPLLVLVLAYCVVDQCCSWRPGLFVMCVWLLCRSAHGQMLHQTLVFTLSVSP